MRFTLDQSAHDLLRYAQALLGHAVPFGDIATQAPTDTGFTQDTPHEAGRRLAHQFPQASVGTPLACALLTQWTTESHR